MNKKIYSFLGIIAIIFWSTTFAFSRSLTEQIGIITTVALMFSTGGFLGCLVFLRSKKQVQKLNSISRYYLWGCGSLFVFYIACLYLAVGLASTRQQIIEIGLINYLWPSLTIAFSLPILGHRARPFLIPGMIIASIGIFLASIYGVGFSLAKTIQYLQSNWYAYLFALLGAISWSLYSNLARLWGGRSSGAAVPLFILTTGVLFWIISFIFPEDSKWTVPNVIELIYMAVFPTFLGYLCWDVAMRKGDVVLVVSSSYLTPVLSTIISCFYLDLKRGWILWLACGLVFAGSIICKFSLLEFKESKTT